MTSYVDPDVLSAYPKFQALYRDICVNKLNPDGTTKLDLKAQKDLDVFQEDLRKARITAAKRDLLKSYLHSVSYRSDELPAELQELVAIIAATLDAQISREDSSLLRDDIARFKENIKPISKSIWKLALDDLVTLSRISSPDSRHADGENLAFSITSQTQALQDAKDQLRTLRLEISHESSLLHKLYRKAIETSIKILEQTIHGSISRSTKAKAEYLATVAEGMDRKLQLSYQQLLTQTKSEEVEDALKGKQEELDREGMMLRRKVREVEGILEEYRQERVIEGIAKEYAEILSESSRIEAEIERLQESGSRA